MRIRPFIPADQAVARALILRGLREHWGWLNLALNPDLEDISASYVTPRRLRLYGTGSGWKLKPLGHVITDES